MIAAMRSKTENSWKSCLTHNPLTSHGETIAGRAGLLKDRPEGGRGAAARSAVLDQPGPSSTLQPPRDVRLGPTWGGRVCNGPLQS